MELNLKINGMSCMHCVSRVQGAIKALGFDASVDLDTKSATVHGCEFEDKKKIIEAIEDLGFEVE